MNNNNNKQKSENKKQKKQNNNCNDESNKKCEGDLGLASLSYADYILLASTLAYSIFKELDEDDLAMFIVFLYLVITDLQVLRTQSAIIQAHCGQNQGEDEEENLEEEDSDLEPEEAISSVSTSRKSKSKKRRYKGKKKST